MEDKVTSFICNLMLNIMFTSLTYILECNQWSLSTSMYTIDLPQWMVSNGFHKVPVLHLEGRDYEKVHGISSNLPFLLYMMMGCVPFATPQTFSRMVVLPALALPMTRMRKWGHLYCPLSIVRSSICTGAMGQSIFWWKRDNILTHQM